MMTIVLSRRHFIQSTAVLMLLTILNGCTTSTVPDENTDSSENNMVRLSIIKVDATRLEEYNAFLKEEITASMNLEPGVLVLYAVAAKNDPSRITILEIYADEAAYKSHVQTPHFKKYKEGTLDMVEELELVDTDPLIPGLKIK